MSRLDILNASLIKKQELFNTKLQAHIDCVKSSNGQPLNDKRNGQATLNKWEKQNDSLRSLQVSIEKTIKAISNEEYKNILVKSAEVPEAIKNLIEAGTITQWRRHPTYFFVTCVDKARIVLLENGSIGHKYLSSIPSQEQYAIFRDVFNNLKKTLLETTK